jgi:hypothetical protein
VSRRGDGILTTFGESTSGKSLDFEYKSCQLCGCGPWRWYKGVGEIYIDKGRVGEESKGKEMDGCPLILPPIQSVASWCMKTTRRLPDLL